MSFERRVSHQKSRMPNGRGRGQSHTGTAVPPRQRVELRGSARRGQSPADSRCAIRIHVALLVRASTPSQQRPTRFPWMCAMLSHPISEWRAPRPSYGAVFSPTRATEALVAPRGEGT